MKNKGKGKDRSIIIVIIILVIVVIALSVRFFSQYLNDSPEPTNNNVNSYVVSQSSIRPPLISDETVAAAETVAPEVNQETTPSVNGNIGTVQIGNGLQVNELLDILISAMNSPSEYEEYYRRIPSAQLDQLALEEFGQYLNLLRKGIGGTVNSYSTMSLEYVRSVKEEMMKHGDEATMFAESSTFHWLERNDADGETRRFAILIQADQNGTPYLSRDYILAGLDLYAFTRLYYQVVEKGDVAALSELIYTDIDDDAIRKEKAERTIEYYDNYVQGSIDDYRIVGVRMDQLTLAQMVQSQESTEDLDGNVSPGGGMTLPTMERPSNNSGPTPSPRPRSEAGGTASQMTQRYVSIVREGRSFYIYDAIPEQGLSDVRIMQDRNVRLILGDIYSQFQLEGYLGELESVRGHRLSKPYYDRDMLIELVWRDKVMTLLSSDYDMETLEGTGELIGIRNRDPGFMLGDTFFIGMTLHELADEFMFINVRNYSWVDEDMTLNRLLFDGETDTVGEIIQTNPSRSQIDSSIGEELSMNTLADAVRLRSIRRTEAIQSSLQAERDAMRELADNKRDAVERYWDEDIEDSPETTPSDIIETIIPKETIKNVSPE